jgi:hypothetical protein
VRLAERLVLWISAPSGAVSDSHAKADLANSFRAGAVMRSPSTAWGSITPPETSLAISGSVAGSGRPAGRALRTVELRCLRRPANALAFSRFGRGCLLVVVDSDMDRMSWQLMGDLRG